MPHSVADSQASLWWIWRFDDVVGDGKVHEDVDDEHESDGVGVGFGFGFALCLCSRFHVLEVSVLEAVPCCP